MTKDWTGDQSSVFCTLGASNHSNLKRVQHDYYATDPLAVDLLYQQTPFFKGVSSVYEPACGGGHLARRLEELGFEVRATDLYDHGYGESGMDFLSLNSISEDVIVTNPPYKYALEFCQHAVLLCPKVAMFLKLTFLESQRRLAFFQKCPPRYVAVFSQRMQCARNGDEVAFSQPSAACYAWFIWERGYKGNPEILWINKNKV